MSFAEEKQLSTFFLIVSIVVLSVVWLFQAPTAWELHFNWWSVSALIIGSLSVIGLAIDTAWGYLAAVSVGAGIFFGVYLLPFWAQICLMMIGISVALASFVYYGLAKRNRWFTEIKEGKAKFVMKAGELKDILIRWSGRTLDEDYNVVPIDTPTKNGKALKEYEAVKGKLSIRMGDLATMERFTPSKARELKEKLDNQGITDMEELEERAQEGELARNIEGVGERTQEKILDLIEEKSDNLYEPFLSAIDEDGNEAKTPQDAEEVVTAYEEVAQDDPDVKVVKKSWRSRLSPLNYGGLAFYSLFHPLVDILKYKFSWASYTSDGNVVRHENEPIDYMLLKEDTYYFQVKKAEDETLLPLTAEITVPARIVNPKKAKFEIENWLETVINLTKPAVRNALSSEEFQELTGQEEDLSRDIFATTVASGLIGVFREQYGVEIDEEKGIQVENLDPSEDVREATTQEAVATFEANAREEEARGEAAYKETMFEVLKDAGVNVGELEKMKEVEDLSVFALNGIEQAINGTLSEASSETKKEVIENIAELLGESDTSN